MPLDFPAPGVGGSPVTPPTGPSAVGPSAQPGLEAQALIKVRQATTLLAEAMGMLKSRVGTDLGKAVLGALKTLAPQTPGIEEGLGQSELASMLQGLLPARPAGPRGATPPWLGTPQPKPNVMAGPPMGMAR